MSTQKLTSFASEHFEPCNGRDLDFEHVKQACKKQMEIDYKQKGLATNTIKSPSCKQNCMQKVHHLKNLWKISKAKPQTKARYAADTSLISAMKFILTICYSHFITGEPSSLHRKLMTRQQELKQ